MSRFRALVRTRAGYDWRSPCPLYCDVADVASWREAAATMAARAALLAPYVPEGEVRSELDAWIRDVSAMAQGPSTGDAAVQAGRVGEIVEAMLELAEVLEVADDEARRAGVQPPDILAVGAATPSTLGSLAATLALWAGLGVAGYAVFALIRRAQRRAHAREVIADLETWAQDNDEINGLAE